MPEVEPQWKTGPRKKKPRVGRAEPERELATWCEVKVALVCTGRAVLRHHIIRRSQGGGHGPDNTLDLCLNCHDHIHGNVDWARGHGFLP